MRKQVPVLMVAALLAILTLGAAASGAAVQKITITMRDFSFTPSRITLQVGVPVEITLVNKGKVKHEFMVYDMPKKEISSMDGHMWAERANFFHGMGMHAQVTGGEVDRKGGDLFEVEVAKSKTAVVTFTPTKKGTFEFACLIKDHYEAGQKGVLVVK